MLKYLFTCEYHDGSKFQQYPDDVSTQDPKRSAFYDVQHDQLKKFSLRGEGKCFAVDLTTGHFEINGQKIYLHSPGNDLLKDFRLIFFRQHRHNVTVGYTGGIQTSFVPRDHLIVYQLGWQTNDANGHNVQRVIEFE